MNPDQRLMAAIAVKFEEAKANGPNLISATAEARKLAAQFEHKTADEIRDQIVIYWQRYGLFFND